jgi:hypothetical protein
MFSCKSNPEREYCKGCFFGLKIHMKCLGICRGSCPGCAEDKARMRVSTSDRYIPGQFLGRPRTPMMLFDNPAPANTKPQEQTKRRAPVTPLELIQ